MKLAGRPAREKKGRNESLFKDFKLETEAECKKCENTRSRCTCSKPTAYLCGAALQNGKQCKRKLNSNEMCATHGHRPNIIPKAADVDELETPDVLSDWEEVSSVGSSDSSSSSSDDEA